MRGRPVAVFPRIVLQVARIHMALPTRFTGERERAGAVAAAVPKALGFVVSVVRVCVVVDVLS